MCVVLILSTFSNTRLTHFTVQVPFLALFISNFIIAYFYLIDSSSLFISSFSFVIDFKYVVHRGVEIITVVKISVLLIIFIVVVFIFFVKRKRILYWVTIHRTCCTSAQSYNSRLNSRRFTLSKLHSALEKSML